jgi:hypothetical protein
MRNLKSSNDWANYEEVESDPSWMVLHKNFEKLGKFSTKAKYAHSMGDSETTVKWEPKGKGDAVNVRDGTMNIAWKNTCKGYGGNPLEVEVTNRAVTMHQDLGKNSLQDGKLTSNPYIAWTVPTKSRWDWWSYSTRFGLISQFGVRGWDVVYSENVNWESNEEKDGPGNVTMSSHTNAKRDQNELTVTTNISTRPEQGWQVQSKVGYMRRDKNWSLWLRHNWFGLNPLGEESVFTLGSTYNANSKTTIAACAEYQVDPEESYKGDGNVQLGATFKAHAKFALTGKLSAVRNMGAQSYKVGLHLNNKWCPPFETNFVVEATKDNWRRPQWGLNIANNC